MKQIIKSLYQYSRNEYIKKLIFNAFHKDYRIRESVAKNQNTPIHILEKLSNDEKNFVRQHVALNPKTPASILEKLSNDENYSVRYSIASNPNTPIHVLKKLMSDRNNNISENALETIKNKELKIYEAHS